MSKRLKGKLKCLVKRIDELLTSSQELLSSDASPVDTKTSREQITTRIALLKDLQQRYEDLDEKIEEAEEDNEATLEEGEETMELVLRMTEMSVKLSSRLETIDRESENPSRKGNSSEAIESQLAKLIELDTAKSTRQTSSDGFVNLPKLDFTPFRGDVLKWNEFWDSFAAAVDSNPSLQPVQKLAYLLSKLRDEAKGVVAGFQTTNDNYSIVVDLLRQRFGNQQAAITAHYSKIMEQPPSPNHTNKLRSLHDELEQHLRCLSSLGEDTEHRHFISLIMTKLPKAVIIKLEEMKDPSEAWTVELVRQKLQNHLVARESADLQGTPVFPRDNRSMNGGYPPHQSTKKRFGQHENTSFSSTARERPSRYSTAEMLYASDKEKRVKSPLCVFCTQKLWSDECDKFRTIDSRKRRIKGRCFNCLGKNHNFRSCPSVKPCFHCKKVKSHHSCLCPEKFPVDKESAHVAVDEPEQESADESLLASGERALLQTALVDVISPRSYQTVKLRLLFDSGSHRSYISEDAVQKLGLKWTGSETISVNTFGAVKSKSVKTKIVEFSLKLQDGNSTTIVGNVVPTISASIQRQPINLKKYQTALKGLALADKFSNKHENASIDILIGSDYYMDLITFETKAVGDGLHLLSSKFGWILTGRVPKKDSSNVEHSMLILNATNQTLPNLFFWQTPDKSCPINPNTEEFWSLESIGIKDSPSEISDEQAIEKFNKTVKHEEGRYFVKWPWREETSQLPSNYQLSLGRLNTLIRRFNQNPELMKKYANIIEDQLAKGVIEKVEKDHNESVVHYIPHQAIMTPQKNTTKVRIVYDASAKTRKEACSLNECLLRGPVILENLCGLLMRFHLHKYGIVADIEKAFLQVGLQEPDRDVVRFLWLKDSSKVTTFNNLQIYRFCRVPFGVISSPFLLGATLVHHLGKSETAIAHQISENLYVDNMITGASTLEQTQRLYTEGKSLFRQASMNLREWTSNCEGFMTKIPETDRCSEDSPKILGMVWKIKNDSLTFPSVNWDMTSSHVTNREVFKKIAKLFDPLGFVSPVAIRGKMFFTEPLVNRLEMG